MADLLDAPSLVLGLVADAAVDISDVGVDDFHLPPAESCGGWLDGQRGSIVKERVTLGASGRIRK